MLQPDRYEMWQTQYAAERLRLVEALGELTEGGVIEQLQHIGATSVPGLWTASPCVDIGFSVWPFPLTAQQQAVLHDLGYEQVSGEDSAVEQRFSHVSGAFQLFIAEAGSDEWTNCLLLRDYLREADSARESFSVQKQTHAADLVAYAQMKAQIFP